MKKIFILLLLFITNISKSQIYDTIGDYNLHQLHKEAVEFEGQLVIPERGHLIEFAEARSKGLIQINILSGKLEYYDGTNWLQVIDKSLADTTYKNINYQPTYASLSDKPTIPVINNSAVTTALGYTPYNSTNPNGYVSQSGARSSISLTTAGTSGASTYNSSTGVLNIPNYAGSSRVFNNNVARTLNSNFTISTTNDANVSYSVALSVTNPLLVGTSTASAFLEYSTDAGSSWTTVSQVANSSSVGLTVTVAITLPNTFVIGGNIPANALVRIRTTTSGTASATFVRAQEMLY